MSLFFFLLCIHFLSATIGNYKRKIIIDTDGGVNDAFAIIHAMESFNNQLVDIKAITTLSSHTSAYDTFRNVIHVMNLTAHYKVQKQALSIPIGKSRQDIDSSTSSNDGIFGFSHTLNQYPYILSNKRKTLKAFETASYSEELLIHAILQNPNELTLITTGPLTNIYLAEQIHPGITSLLKDIYIFGGQFFEKNGGGNNDSLSEYNFNFDANALKKLFEDSYPNKIIFPMDTSKKLKVGMKQISLIYTLLNKDIQTEIEVCRIKMERDDGMNGDMEGEREGLDKYDESDLYDSDRSKENIGFDEDDFKCTKSSLLYIFYEKMMNEMMKENFMNGIADTMLIGETSIFLYFLYPHLFDFKYVRCKIDGRNGMIYFDERLRKNDEQSFEFPNCFVNLGVDEEQIIHAFTRDAIHMIHAVFLDYMSQMMYQMEW